MQRHNNKTTEVRYLGVNLVDTLSGEGILNTIVKKCSGRIKFLYRQARCFPKTVKKTLCQSLVQSHLDYAISSWYAAMSQKAKNKLQILQNKMIRFMLDLGPRTHITEEHNTEEHITEEHITEEHMHGRIKHSKNPR